MYGVDCILLIVYSRLYIVACVLYIVVLYGVVLCCIVLYCIGLRLRYRLCRDLTVISPTIVSKTIISKQTLEISPLWQDICFKTIKVVSFRNSVGETIIQSPCEEGQSAS